MKRSGNRLVGLYFALFGLCLIGVMALKVFVPELLADFFIKLIGR